MTESWFVPTSITYNRAALALFYENFDPEQVSAFDQELNTILSKVALDQGKLNGFCNLADTATEFVINDQNLRENVHAVASGSINRQRQMVCGLSLALFDHPYAPLGVITSYINEHKLMVYTAEANSTFFAFLQKNIAPELLCYSEYFGNEYKSGQMINGLMHQDLQKTSFEDETFDIVLTTEVFEHIPNAPMAEREVVRILKKGGIYCFTVPFNPYAAEDLILAEINVSGETIYLTEPQYHGDPVRPDQGILVYRIFSFHALKRRFNGLGCQFTTYRLWSKTLGILGDNCVVQVVKKKGLVNHLIEHNSSYEEAPGEQIKQLKLERDQLMTQLTDLQTWATGMEKQLLARPQVAGWLKNATKKIKQWLKGTN